MFGPKTRYFGGTAYLEAGTLITNPSVHTDAMGWIKVQLDDETHDQIKYDSTREGRPIHEYIGEYLGDNYEKKHD